MKTVIFALLALAAANPVVKHTKRASAPAINAGALQLIEDVEGFQGNFYTINGDKTIGFGHDCTQKGDCASIHAPITRQQGVQLLLTDLPSYESCVCAMPNAAKLNANQYGALTSFTYNSGCGGLQKYWTSTMQSGNMAEICSKLPTTNTLGGELSSRRQKEGAFCGQPTSSMSGCDGTSTGPGGPGHSPAPAPATGGGGKVGVVEPRWV